MNPAAPIQPRPEARRSPLAKVDTVAHLTGRSISELYAMADGGDLLHGRLQWVWDVKTNPAGTISDLRFWMGEIYLPERQTGLTLAQVIDFILPPRRCEFPAGEVQSILQVRPPTLSKLRAELHGSLRSGSGFYPRAGLVQFFTRRWLGNLAGRKG